MALVDRRGMAVAALCVAGFACEAPPTGSTSALDAAAMPGAQQDAAVTFPGAADASGQRPIDAAGDVGLAGVTDGGTPRDATADAPPASDAGAGPTLDAAPVPSDAPSIDSAPPAPLDAAPRDGLPSSTPDAPLGPPADGAPVSAVDAASPDLPPGPAPDAAPAVPDAPPAITCAPTAPGPLWAEEGQTVTAKVACSTGRPSGPGAFAVAGLPPGAIFDAATATLTWKTALDAAGVYTLPISDSATGETGTLKIGVADRFDDPANVPIRDLAAYTEELGLPVFHLAITPEFEAKLAVVQAERDALGADSCKPACGLAEYAPVTVVYRGHTYKAEGHYRGATSLSYPKKNYTLRFPKDDRFSEPILAGGRITGRRRLALITTFDDNSYVRWRLAFELWNRVHPAVIPIPHFSAVVYVNGTYHGLYTVSDKIDDDMMKRAGLAEEGNLYAGVDHNASFEALVTERDEDGNQTLRARRCPFEGFAKKEGRPAECNGTTFVPGAFEDLASLVDFVAHADAATFRSRIASVVDLNDYLGWLVHGTAIMAEDSFAKNAHHYHDPIAGGKWRTVVWDYNASFGQDWQTVRRPATVDPLRAAATTSRPVTNNLWRRLLGDPVLGPEARAHYKGALAGELAVGRVLADFDAFAAETAQSARRDQRKWGVAYRRHYGTAGEAKRTTFTTYDQEIAYTRKWIGDRWTYLRSLFP